MTLRILLLISLSSAAHAGTRANSLVRETRWNRLRDRIGLIATDDSRALLLCVGLHGIRAGTPVTVVSVDSQVVVLRLRLGAELDAKRDSAIFFNVRVDSVTAIYELTGADPESLDGTMLGIVSDVRRFRWNGKSIDADLDGDGSIETIRGCSGYEGYNVIVRDAASRTRIWHGYESYGFEVEEGSSTCTEEDLE